MSSGERIHDVIIIGAGYSGLSAGLYFSDCKVDNFIILEARNRVGGRVCTEYVKLDNGTKCYVDAGGAYVGPGQNRMLRMLNRFGIKTFHVNMKGKSTLNYNNRLSYYIGTLPSNIGIFTLCDLNAIFIETDKLAQQINTIDINKSNMNKQLLKKYDNMTISEWLNTIIKDKEAKEQYIALCRALLCVEVSEVSMLHWLKLVKSANNTSHLIETEKGAQDSKIIGGSHGLCDAIAKEIKKHINLKHIVKCIEQNKDYITIHCQNSLSFKTKYVLCTIAPTLYNKIEWKPNLSWNRQSISYRMPMGFIVKINVYFKTAFWRFDGLNGLSINICNNINENPIVLTFDDCKPDGTYPSIIGFVVADQATKYMQMSYEKRKDCVLKQYAKIFKNKKAITECIGYFEKKWNEEEFSGGCYAGVVGCNVLTSEYWKILKKPENNCIYFAGTELADKWIGYMDGAIQSGEREANKITNILAKINSEINVKKIFDGDSEPECKNCQLPFVKLEPSYIEKHILPKGQTVQICLFLCLILVVIVGLYIAGVFV